MTGDKLAKAKPFYNLMYEIFCQAFQIEERFLVDATMVSY